MKKTLLTFIALCLLAIPAKAVDFSDVPQDHWAYTAIQQTVEANVAGGYKDGTFRPGTPVTASHFCAFLSRSFVDVSTQPEGPDQILNACLPVLRGTAVETAYNDNGGRWGDFIHQPLSRYDAAQIVFNVAYQKNALQEAVTVSTTDIADWEDIPDHYRGTVMTCWGKGLLQGQSGGRFAGEDGLNRAQACVIWSRLNALISSASEASKEEETAVEMPAFGLQGEETAKEMMRRINHATPICKEGCLPNGKPRTEENIQELLELVKAGCPDGTVWSRTDRYSYWVSQMGAVRGSLAFGLAVSDFVFGEEAPLKWDQNLRNLSAGDVVHILSADRVLILTSVDYEEDLFTACELRNSKVNWSGWGPLSGLLNTNNVTTVYRRWK